MRECQHFEGCEARVDWHCARTQNPERTQIGKEFEAIAVMQEDTIAARDTEPPICGHAQADLRASRGSVPPSPRERLNQVADM